MVKEILSSSNHWDEAAVKSHLISLNNEHILSMALPTHPVEDTLVWHYEKRGNFSVKSAYHLAVDLKSSMRASSSSCGTLWNEVWNIELPAKIKVFIWRALSGLIPTALKLHQKKILDLNLCPRCRSHPETGPCIV